MDYGVSAQLLRQDGEPTLFCGLYPGFMRKAIYSRASCWHDLFTRTVIVNCPRVREEEKFIVSKLHDLALKSTVDDLPTELGLEIHLNRMVSLASAETLVEHNGGLVFLGLSTILVPIRWLNSNTLQWHLLAEPIEKRISLWRIDEDIPQRVLIVKARTLQKVRRHYLALWPRANKHSFGNTQNERI